MTQRPTKEARLLFQDAMAVDTRPFEFESLDVEPTLRSAGGRAGAESFRVLTFEEHRGDGAPSAGDEGVCEEAEPVCEGLREHAGASNVLEITMMGYVEGFAKGRDEGRQAARDEVRVAVGHLLQVAEAVRLHRSETVVALEDELIELALCIAERVLHTEVSARGAQVASRLADLGVARLGECTRVVVQMHPEDLRRLALETHTQQGSVSYVADATLTRGDAVVQSERGRVDARLGAQLDELRAELQTRDVEDDR